MRRTDNPNVRVQDGLKQSWLCGSCETLFSGYETAFANRIFHPWHAGERNLQYQEWMLKFAVTVSWRVLKFAFGQNPNALYAEDQLRLLDEAEASWRAFLKGEAPHPGKFEQHLVPFDLMTSSNIADLPSNFNRFITGAVTLDIVGSEGSLMTFAKLGGFLIFGMIQKGPSKWEGTKLHVREGRIASGKVVLPAGLLDLLIEKSNHARMSMRSMSDHQRLKIDTWIEENIETFANSDQFRAIKADAKMFGSDAVTQKGKKPD